MATRRNDPLDDEIRGLYQGPLGDWTPTRQALLKRLQKAHDPRAAEVKELRKPTPSAWAVNQLFAHEPEAMSALLATGARAHGAVERALAKSDGTEVRAALDSIRTGVAHLAGRAVELLSAGGAAPSAAVEERLRANLDALVLDPARAPLAERRWLEVDLDAPGFDVLAALQLAAEKGRGRPEPARPAAVPAPSGRTAAKPAPAQTKAPTPAAEAKITKTEAAARAREEAEREQRIAAARADLERLESALEAKRAAANEAASAAAEATAKAAEAASDAELARRAAHDARRAVDATSTEVVRAREAVRRAERS